MSITPILTRNSRRAGPIAKAIDHTWVHHHGPTGHLFELFISSLAHSPSHLFLLTYKDFMIKCKGEDQSCLADSNVPIVSRLAFPMPDFI